jgi:hypothetical protein
MTASSSTSPSRGARIAAVIVLGLLGMLIVAQGGSNPAPVTDDAQNAALPTAPGAPETGTPFHTPPSPDVTALLNGLTLGNEIDGWKVVSFNVMKEKIVWIEVGKDGIYFSIGVTTKGKSGTQAPIQTELYDIMYGMLRPQGTNLNPDVSTKLTEEIASRVRMREKEVAKPAVL